MAEVGASCLALEAGACIFFEMESALDYANRHDIAIIAQPGPTRG